MNTVWDLTISLDYTDNTTREFSAVKDDFGFRIINGTIDDFSIATSLPKLNTFLLAIGYGSQSPDQIPNDISNYAFRFGAIATGSIHTLGSSSYANGEALSDDLNDTLVVLNSDQDFVDLFSNIGNNDKFHRVALLANTNYVDYTIGDPTRGASNLQAGFESLGFTVLPFTDISDIGFTEAVNKRCTLVIPELENGALNIDISGAARSVIYDFVSGGGTLMVFANDTRALEVVNGIFGPSLGTSLSSDITRSPIRIDDVIGTPFDGGPDPISMNSSIGSLDNSGTNALISFREAKSIYREDNAGGHCTVFLIPFFAGNIVLFGWNWRDAVPVGIQNGGWLEVLRRAIQLC